MTELLQRQKDYFNTNETKSYAFRIKQLQTLKKLLINHEQDILNALHKDLHKSRFESYSSEIGFCLHSLSNAIKHLHKWMKPRKVRTPLYLLNTKSYIYPEPVGSVLIIGPFNYPFQLIFEPLIGAIAAGNTAIIKPSEISTNTEQVIQTILNNHFDAKYIHVVTGDVEVSQNLIRQPFDHIFFTGSTFVGQKVYEAASKNLVPVTLELGGKSPTIVTKDVNLKMAAKRIAFGKFINAGQSCVAPDYVYVEHTIYESFITELDQAFQTFLDPTQFGHIINQRHYNRLVALLDPSKTIHPLDVNEQELYIAPTILKDVSWNDPVMKEEIFGPILPVLSYHNLDDVISIIKANPKPLALYLFTTNNRIQQKVLTEVSFGGGAINDAVMQYMNPHLPFGGIGQSGMGQYHGKASFDVFSHKKSYIKRSFLIDPSLPYPPHSRFVESLFRKLLK